MLGLFVDSVPPEKAYQLAQAGHDWLCVDAAAEPLAAARLGELLGAIASGGSSRHAPTTRSMPTMPPRPRV